MARSHREHVGTRTAGIEDGRQTHRVAWNTQVYAAAGVQTTRALQMNHESGEFWKFSPERLRVANRRRSRTDKPTTRLPRPGGEVITVVFGQIRHSVMATTCVASIAKEPLCGSP